MKILPLLLVTLSFIIACNPSHKELRLSEQSTPVEFYGKIIKNRVYGTNINFAGQQQDLPLDIYIPAADSIKKYPLIVYIHGGGFRVGDKDSSTSFCELLANKGFVVASINYRLGWTRSDSDPCDGNPQEAIKAFYRGMQDTRTALRYMVANADSFLVDTGWIFVSGASAGGVACLSAAYDNQQTVDKYFPGVSKTLGLLDNAGNALKNPYTVKGVAALWGSLINSDVITSENARPTIFFHGEKDNVVPYDIGHFYSCDKYLPSYGTKPLYDRLSSLGMPVVAHIDPDGGHGVYTQEFRADNIACFFGSLMKKIPPKSGFYIGNQSSCK